MACRARAGQSGSRGAAAGERTPPRSAPEHRGCARAAPRTPHLRRPLPRQALQAAGADVQVHNFSPREVGLGAAQHKGRCRQRRLGWVSRRSEVAPRPERRSRPAAGRRCQPATGAARAQRSALVVAERGGVGQPRGAHGRGELAPAPLKPAGPAVHRQRALGGGHAHPAADHVAAARVPGGRRLARGVGGGPPGRAQAPTPAEAMRQSGASSGCGPT